MLLFHFTPVYSNFCFFSFFVLINTLVCCINIGHVFFDCSYYCSVLYDQ